MEVTSFNLHHGSNLVEHTPWKLPHGTSPWKLPHGTYTMEVTSWNLYHGSYLIEHTQWKLPNVTYTIEVTS